MYGLTGGFLKLNNIEKFHWCGTVGNVGCKNVLIKPTAMGAMANRCCMPIEERARIKSVCALKKALSLNRACVFGAGRAESVA